MEVHKLSIKTDKIIIDKDEMSCSHSILSKVSAALSSAVNYIYITFKWRLTNSNQTDSSTILTFIISLLLFPAGF